MMSECSNSAVLLKQEVVTSPDLWLSSIPADVHSARKSQEGGDS